MKNVQPTDALCALLRKVPERVAVFEQYGIDFSNECRRSLTEACAERGLELAEVRRALEAVTPGDGAFPCGGRPDADCPGMIRHIVDVHHGYLRRTLPRIAELTARTMAAHYRRFPFLRVFEAVVYPLQTELEEHMQKEEQILFPAIERLVGGVDSPFHTIGAPVGCMVEEHREALSALEKMREVSSNFALPDQACATWRELYEVISELERDLRLHIHEENNILFPAAMDLERRVRQVPPMVNRLG